MSTYDDKEIKIEDEKFRDSISTVDKQGKRVWIYPTKPKGRYYEYRKYVSYVLLAVLIVLPFIKVDGHPLFMFNVIKEEFYLFGSFFGPQDMYLFVIAMLIAVIGIALFTVVFGRLFCGWVCPQTIFMEMVFRRIEYAVEGDANAQRKLNKQSWTSEKITKKTIKHALFILVSIIICHIFLSYIIGVDGLLQTWREPFGEHIGGFIAMVAFTIVFYGVFSVMREQVCTTICPYGRLQSVLLDNNSLTVAYDFERGEPRGKIKKKKKDTMVSLPVVQKGDCIDCGLCVRVCPTGIDIRNGTQLECVNCTACIDACDGIMDKVNKPRGLIRFDSYNGITQGKQKFWSPKAIGYTALLVLMIGLEGFLLFSRSQVQTLLLRTPGVPYQKTEDGYISNLYDYHLINKSNIETDVKFVVEGKDYVKIEFVGNPPKTIKHKETEGVMFVKIPRDKLEGRTTEFKVSVIGGDGRKLDETTISFLGPRR